MLAEFYGTQCLVSTIFDLLWPNIAFWLRALEFVLFRTKSFRKSNQTYRMLPSKFNCQGAGICGAVPFNLLRNLGKLYLWRR